MSGNHRHDSPGPDSAASGLLVRWSERKRATVQRGKDVLPAEPRDPPVTGNGDQQSGTGEAQKVLTDADMPRLESLNEESDYSGFLSPGVSRGLQRLALRKLFSAAKFQVRDGLDDYDTDYHLLQPLRRVLAGVTQEKVAQRLQHASGKLMADARDAAINTDEEPERTGADSRQQDPAAKLSAGRMEESGS
jgi:Protein of unknown function (DUF3306)